MLGTDIANLLSSESNSKPTNSTKPKISKIIPKEKTEYVLPNKITLKETTKYLNSIESTTEVPAIKKQSSALSIEASLENKQYENKTSAALQPSSKNLIAPKSALKAIEPQISNTNSTIFGDKWLISQPKENYSLQLASFSRKADIHAYIEKLDFLSDKSPKLFKSINGLYYVLYGSYKTLNEARQVQAKIPFGKDIWVRKIGVLRATRCRNRGIEASNPAC